jgi:hypothetical protein
MATTGVLFMNALITATGALLAAGAGSLQGAAAKPQKPRTGWWTDKPTLAKAARAAGLDPSVAYAWARKHPKARGMLSDEAFIRFVLDQRAQRHHKRKAPRLPTTGA